MVQGKKGCIDKSTIPLVAGAIFKKEKMKHSLIVTIVASQYTPGEKLEIRIEEMPLLQMLKQTVNFSVNFIDDGTQVGWVFLKINVIHLYHQQFTFFIG